MGFEFSDAFTGQTDHAYPDGWRLERHSGLSHGHAYVLNGAFALMLPGNRHVARSPPLRDFALEIRCRGDSHFSTVTGLVVYFRYDPAAQCGYYLWAQWGVEGITAVFGVYADGTYRPLQTQQVALPVQDTSTAQILRLTAAGERFDVFLGDTAVSRFADPSRTFDQPGQIALDNSAAAGAAPKRVSALGRHVFLESVRVTSAQDFPAHDIWPPIRVAFPPAVNGMQTPFVFEICARETGGCHTLRVRLTGGSTNEPPAFPGGFYRCNEELVRPYIRLELPDGAELGPYRLVNGSVGLRVSRDKRNFLFFPAAAECPLEATVHLAKSPAGARLFVGYEFYQHEGVPHQRGGPTEAWVDARTGRVRYVGAPLRIGCRIAELHSPDDKAICRRLPTDDPRHDQALAFARANHFFMEGEPSVFRACLRLRHPAFSAEKWTPCVHVENAFFERISARLTCRRHPADDAVSAEMKTELGVETVTAVVRVRSPLPVGVYHLVVHWREGTQLGAESRCAFEVMPTDPQDRPAPLASGLPELHSFPDECSGLASGPFDPWQAATVDVCHYLTGTYYQANFGRANQVWKTLHVYGRQWQLLLFRDPADFDPVRDADIIHEADLVCTRPWGSQARCDLWKRQSYTGDVLAAFRQFVQERVPEAAEQQRLTETATPDGVLTPTAFRMLATRYWKAWLDWFARFATLKLQEMHQFVQSVNPRARWKFLYALYPPYASVYKGSYFASYMGYDVTQPPLRSMGPLFLEDYPYACRYRIQRGVYQLAAMKLAAPEQRIFVEMYAGCAVPVDGGLLFAHPPYSACYVPPAFFRKRLFEFAYGAVWFGQTGFTYWRDYGFHARTWDREQYEAVIRTWARIHRAPPVKPLRTTAFGLSPAACRQHPDHHEPARPSAPFDDIYNTAEECTAYAYEQARADGQPAGFLLDVDAIARLDPADVDTLVLPPLTGLSPDTLGAVREKHRQGVNLLGFEDVNGLEDLFGVTRLPEAVPVCAIRLNPEFAGTARWRQLAGLPETCSHPLCRTAYALQGARALLDGTDAHGCAAGPALTVHQTEWGWTALFCVPPTVVNRADQTEHVQYGQECLSHLMDRSTALVLRFLGRPQAETTAGKLLAFRDETGRVHAIVTEDAWPETPGAIAPRVTLHLPGLRREQISCDQPFSILELTPDGVAVRLALEPHASAVITVCRELHPERSGQASKVRPTARRRP